MHTMKRMDGPKQAQFSPWKPNLRPSSPRHLHLITLFKKRRQLSAARVLVASHRYRQTPLPPLKNTSQTAVDLLRFFHPWGRLPILCPNPFFFLLLVSRDIFVRFSQICHLYAIWLWIRVKRFSQICHLYAIWLWLWVRWLKKIMPILCPNPFFLCLYAIFWWGFRKFIIFLQYDWGFELKGSREWCIGETKNFFFSSVVIFRLPCWWNRIIIWNFSWGCLHFFSRN